MMLLPLRYPLLLYLTFQMEKFAVGGEEEGGGLEEEAKKIHQFLDL